MNWCLQEGDCVKLMQALPAECVHSIVADPPYGLEFMGKEFDKLGHGRAQQEWHRRWAVEAFRIALPGAHILAFGGTRTYHRLASALEDAGWEIRDSIHWTYGSGFPKSHSIPVAIDGLAGVERPVIEERTINNNVFAVSGTGTAQEQHRKKPLAASITANVTDEAKKFSGYGTALKPAHEPICVARKPISERNIAANVLKHGGCGGLNIDGCRIEGAPWTWGTQTDIRGGGYGSKRPSDGHVFARNVESDPKGRWPANVMLTHSADCRQVGTKKVEAWECVEGCPVPALDERSGGRSTTGGTAGFQDGGMVGGVGVKKVPRVGYEDEGGASRFFSTTGWEPEFDTHALYHPKVSRSERKGLAQGTHDNSHPTVKPVALMQQLVRLVTPPDGVVLDPFCGSGSTGVAAIREGFKFLGMEQDPEYAEIARRRLAGDFPLVSREVPIDSIIAGK